MMCLQHLFSELSMEAAIYTFGILFFQKMTLFKLLNQWVKHYVYLKNFPVWIHPTPPQQLLQLNDFSEVLINWLILTHCPFLWFLDHIFTYTHIHMHTCTHTHTHIQKKENEFWWVQKNDVSENFKYQEI